MLATSHVPHVPIGITGGRAQKAWYRRRRQPLFGVQVGRNIQASLYLFGQSATGLQR